MDSPNLTDPAPGDHFPRLADQRIESPVVSDQQSNLRMFCRFNEFPRTFDISCERFFNQDRAPGFDACTPLSRVQSGRSRKNHSVSDIRFEHVLEFFESCQTVTCRETPGLGIGVGNCGKGYVFDMPYGIGVTLARQPESSNRQPGGLVFRRHF